MEDKRSSIEKLQKKKFDVCCPNCSDGTEKLCSKRNGSIKVEQQNNKIIEEELSEESPLKKDQAAECQIGEKSSAELKALICCIILLLLAIVGIIILNVLLSKTKSFTKPIPSDKNQFDKNPLGPSTTPPKEQNQSIPHGAVATDYAECSRIGTDILRSAGNAIDAAVAASVCIAVVLPHKTGFGGGGKMMVYSHKDRKDPLVVDFGANTNAGIFATAKVRLPGFLRGLEFVQSLRGNLPWKSVIEPSIQLAEEGFVISEELAYEATKTAERGMIYGHLTAGEKLQIPELAETLKAIGQYGCDVLYNGTWSTKFLRDAVVKEDLLRQLSSYEPRVVEVRRVMFNNHIVYLPADATTFQSAIEHLEKLKVSRRSASSVNSDVDVAKAIIKNVSQNKKMLKQLLDEEYSNVAVMDPNDNYVSVVTGLSTPLGLSHLTGAGFLIDGVATKNNLEYLTPIIFHDDKEICELRGVFGTDDPALAAQILYNLLERSLNVSEAIEYSRYYVLPDGVSLEINDQHSMDPRFLAKLENLVQVSQTSYTEISKSVNAITKHKEDLTSHSDSRGGGQASRF